MTLPRPVVSAAAERIYDGLHAYTDGDADSGWLLLGLCEAHARLRAKPTEALRHDDRGSGLRRMHDPTRAPAWALEHLAQYAGVQAATAPDSDQLRALIRERPRARRCTRPLLEQAVAATLVPVTAGAPLVRIVERDDRPWRLTIITRATETPDPDRTRRAALTQKPWGVRLVLVVSDEPTWTEATKTWDQLDPALTWDNARIGDV